MLNVDLSLRIISYFGEEHGGGISAQIEIKSKKSRVIDGEREFWTYKVAVHTNCHEKSREKMRSLIGMARQ